MPQAPAPKKLDGEETERSAGGEIIRQSVSQLNSNDGSWKEESDGGFRLNFSRNSEMSKRYFNQNDSRDNESFTDWNHGNNECESDTRHSDNSQSIEWKLPGSRSHEEDESSIEILWKKESGSATWEGDSLYFHSDGTRKEIVMEAHAREYANHDNSFDRKYVTREFEEMTDSKGLDSSSSDKTGIDSKVPSMSPSVVTDTFVTENESKVTISPSTNTLKDNDNERSVGCERGEESSKGLEKKPEITQIDLQSLNTKTEKKRIKTNPDSSLKDFDHLDVCLDKSRRQDSRWQNETGSDGTTELAPAYDIAEPKSITIWEGNSEVDSSLGNNKNLLDRFVEQSGQGSDPKIASRSLDQDHESSLELFNIDFAWCDSMMKGDKPTDEDTAGNNKPTSVFSKSPILDTTEQAEIEERVAESSFEDSMSFQESDKNNEPVRSRVLKHPNEDDSVSEHEHPVSFPADTKTSETHVCVDSTLTANVELSRQYNPPKYHTHETDESPPPPDRQEKTSYGDRSEDSFCDNFTDLSESRLKSNSDSSVSSAAIIIPKRTAQDVTKEAKIRLNCNSYDNDRPFDDWSRSRLRAEHAGKTFWEDPEPSAAMINTEKLPIDPSMAVSEADGDGKDHKISIERSALKRVLSDTHKLPNLRSTGINDDSSMKNSTVTSPSSDEHDAISSSCVSDKTSESSEYSVERPAVKHDPFLVNSKKPDERTSSASGNTELLPPTRNKSQINKKQNSSDTLQHSPYLSDDGSSHSPLNNDATEDSSEMSMNIGEVFGETRVFDDSNNDEADQSVPNKASRKINDGEKNDSILSASQKSKNSKIIRRTNSKKVLSEKDKLNKKKRKKRRRRRKREAKSIALLDFAANVNETILSIEDTPESNEKYIDSSAYRLLHGFDALLGIFLQLSDEFELIVTFSQTKIKTDEKEIIHVHALKAILSFVETFDQLFTDLKPIILDCFDEEPDEYMDEVLYRLNSLVDLICETTHRVGERQEWSDRAETTYVTLLELIEQDSLDLRCYFDDVETPDQGISANVHEAWLATGHIEELKALQHCVDPILFRNICYEVMVSTDQWCPDINVLMEVCDVDPEMLDEEPIEGYMDENELAPVPQAAEHILDKVNGDTLRRLDVFASILRRILPPRAVTDVSLLDHFTSIRNTANSPLGLSATNIVSITSIPESIDSPDALGVAGVGKTTLAAMVAEHPDVRRHFIDGVVWVYVGEEELNYNRYTQCLRELVAQLDFYDGVPLFAELLHIPGEKISKRRRREEGFMIYARDTIAGLLENRSVLIILDDVCWEPDMDWFDFAPMPDESLDGQGDNCALVITTRCRHLLPAADTVEIDMLDEADAISLLIQESGQLSHTLMAESKEARSVVRECANHPLAVKSVGRWLNLKHATAGVVSSVEEIHLEVIKSMDKILRGGDNTRTDMMYEILSTSLSPAINGGPTNIIKFCFAAFIVVFCDRNHISEFALIEPTPIIPMDMAELLFQTLLEMYEVSLLKKGSLFYAQKKEAAVLIPEALSALGVLKVITYTDGEEDEENLDEEQKYLQVMHSIHHEYGEYLAHDDPSLKDFTKDAERQWNRAIVDAYVSRVNSWDVEIDDAAHSYALEMIVSHMIRGAMYNAAADLLADKGFIRGRLLSLGRENATKRHVKDCEMLCLKLKERKSRSSKLEFRTVMRCAYQAFGRQLTMNTEESIEDVRIKQVDVARAHYEVGFSLAEHRCWSAAIAHWESSHELLLAALGSVEVVAGILYNIGVVFSEMNEYDQALDALKRCLKIRGAIHGEEHILYGKTIQKIGDVFLNMSDYHEAMESYDWALDVMYKEPDHHNIEIGEILDNKGTIHYSKGEIEEALQCHQEALRSKQQDLGEDHPELSPTYHHIGNCLSDQGNVDDAIVHFEEAIRLKELDSEGGPEGDADVLTIEGILNNLEGNQSEGLGCYERSLQILVTKVPYRKEKIASLLHLIGCVYLMSGEEKKAMKLFEESLQARRKVLGFVHLDVASTLFNMAFLHQTRKKLDKALRCLEEALKIRQLRLPDSEKVAVTHEKIGSLARAIGKAKKAQIAFEEALRIRKLIHGEQHEAVATVLQELGDLMDDLAEYDSAMSFYIDALDIRRSRLGLDDIAVAETLYSMGYTLNNNNEPERALVCFVEALSIRRYQLGEDSKEVGDTLNMMGFLKAKKGQLDDALTLLWDALRIRKLQEDHVKVSETLKNIGNVHREKEELDLAVECYEECLRIRRAELGKDHEKVADALIAMGNIHSDMKKTVEAMNQYQEALRIRTRTFGENDERVAGVLHYMGTLEFRANNYEKARHLLTEFIRIRRDNGTKHDGDFVNVLFMIGNVYKMEGKENQSKKCWNEAYQVFQELGLSDTNPQIAEVMNNLLTVENLDEYEIEPNNRKSLIGIVTEKFKKEKLSDGLHQKVRTRRKGKGVKL